jgi:two-component system phosphate regulon response regulator PhoB
LQRPLNRRTGRRVYAGTMKSDSKRDLVAAVSQWVGKRREIVKDSVLIVDEDVNARIIAETLLQTRGLRVRSVGDGKEAYELVRREGAAVVLLDLALAGMNGLEVIRRLRGRFEALPLPHQPRIIVVSDRAEPEVERFALRLGADAFLHKPVAPARLIGTVENFLALPHPPASVGTAA